MIDLRNLWAVVVDEVPAAALWYYEQAAAREVSRRSAVVYKETFRFEAGFESWEQARAPCSQLAASLVKKAAASWRPLQGCCWVTERALEADTVLLLASSIHWKAKLAAPFQLRVWAPFPAEKVKYPLLPKNGAQISQMAAGQGEAEGILLPPAAPPYDAPPLLQRPIQQPPPQSQQPLMQAKRVSR